jgi:hypothetical protein
MNSGLGSGLGVTALMLGVAGCGGWGDAASTAGAPESPTAIASDAAVAKPLPAETPRPIAMRPAVAQASTHPGAWSAEAPWPLNANHAALPPDGCGLASGSFIYDVWDPSGDALAANHITLPNTTATDTFCSAQLMLSSGPLLIASGGIFG